MTRVLSDVQFLAKWVIKLNEKTSQNQMKIKPIFVDSDNFEKGSTFSHFHSDDEP